MQPFPTLKEKKKRNSPLRNYSLIPLRVRIVVRPELRSQSRCNLYFSQGMIECSDKKNLKSLISNTQRNLGTIDLKSHFSVNASNILKVILFIKCNFCWEVQVVFQQ